MIVVFAWLLGAAFGAFALAFVLALRVVLASTRKVEKP